LLSKRIFNFNVASLMAIMKRILMKISLVTGIVLLLWIVFAQSCMTFRKADTEAITQFKKNGVDISFNTITVSSRQLHYAQTGDNKLPTIVFVHGTPGSWDAFEGYLKDAELLQKFRLIAIDRPGFGHSDFGQALNLTQQSLVISPLFDHIKNGAPVYLVGHSLGGPMICRLAADNPGLFAGLIILAGSQDPAAEKPEKWRPVLYKSPLKYLVPGALRPSNEELWYLKQDLVNLSGDLSKITCPVFLLHGTKDVLVPFSNLAYTESKLVNASKKERIVFENENHFIPWTRFKEIKALLLKL
jgi:pimeloyl-ACP methyl ester carboxylesterase